MLKQTLSKVIAVATIAIGAIFVAGCGDDAASRLGEGQSGPEAGEDDADTGPDTGNKPTKEGEDDNPDKSGC